MHPIELDATLKLAKTKLRSGQIQEAEAMYRRLLEKQPGGGEAIHFLGLAMAQRGKKSEAMELVRRSIELKPDSADYHNNLATVLGQFGNATEALGAAQRAIEKIEASKDRVPVLQWSDPADLSTEALLDTAALIQNLDLVITCDTAIAHLAGALGAPTWLALPLAAEWRWLVGRDDTPWYPTMRLFRQSDAGDWAAVFQGMAEELSGAISEDGKAGNFLVKSPQQNKAVTAGT